MYCSQLSEFNFMIHRRILFIFLKNWRRSALFGTNYHIITYLWKNYLIFIQLEGNFPGENSLETSIFWNSYDSSEVGED